MSNRKYADIPAILNVIGNIYNKPALLNQEDKYIFNEEDFPTEFHKIVFGSIFNLHQLKSDDINPLAIENYLQARPTKFAIYKANKGSEYLLEAAKHASLASFDYYYNRMKKMSLLKAYAKAGMDLSWLYDVDNLTDSKKKQAQEDWLDHTPLEIIADTIDDKIQAVRENYLYGNTESTTGLGEGIFELLTELQEHPDIGVPLFGPFVNTVTRGARLGKFYLRSAATNVGKSRALMADALYLSCSEMWDVQKEQWISLQSIQPTLFISTELELRELQTMALAFISGVNEAHILKKEYLWGEKERVERAAEVIHEAPIFIEQIPDFSVKDIENTIKRGIREEKCSYIFLDYIHTSMKILEEITQRSGGVRLREDNILFLLSVQLKDICSKYKVFIYSATQLNMDYQHSKTPDQNLLRGAKAIADKIDFGCIMLDVTNDDLESLSSITGKQGLEVPDIKLSIYKNRGNQYNRMYLWMKADRGISQFRALFATTWNYKLIELEDTEIVVEGSETSEL